MILEKIANLFTEKQKKSRNISFFCPNCKSRVTVSRNKKSKPHIYNLCCLNCNTDFKETVV